MHETSTVTPARHDARPSARPPGWGAALLRCGSPWCRARPWRQGPPPCAEARGAGSPRRRRRGTMPARGRSDLRRRSSWRATATSTGVDMPAPRPGGGGPPRRTRPGRVPETWVPRGRGRREGPERRQAPAVPVPRTPPRRGHRGHVRIPPHACGRSGGVPARDALARGPGRAPPGQTGDRRRLPPAGPPGRSPCRPGHGAASCCPATCGSTRSTTRSRAGTSDARRTGRGHAGRRGTRSVSPSAATGGAGRTPRASAWGSQASPGRGRRMRATSRGAPTRHATWRGATRRSSGSPGRRRRPTTRGGQGHSRTRRIHYTRSTSYATCRGCSRARIPDSTGRGRGVSRPVPRDDEPSRREDGEGCLRARPRNAFPIYVEMPRALPKEDQLKGNSVLLGTHNQQRRIFKKFFWPARGPAELRRGVIGLCRAAV